MCLEDVGEVALIEAQIFSHPWTHDNFLESLELDDTIYLVAKQCATEKIIGYCGCYQSFEEGNISNVAVAPVARRQGVAHALLVELIMRGTNMGIQTFSLEVRKGNEAAKSLYRGLGFETVGIRRGFYETPKEDAEIMLLHVDSNSHYSA